MANLKLKDGIGQEQNYEDIKEVAIPKADGSGYEFYMERPTIYYTLLDPPTYDLSAEDTSIIALNAGEGAFLGKAYDKGNFSAGISAAVSGKTTKSIVSVKGTDVTGIGEGEKNILYLYESVSGANLKEIIGFEGSTDFVAQPGWGYLFGSNGVVAGYVQITDPSAVSIGCLQPNQIYSERNFYAIFSETSQETKTVSVTENGSQKIVPSEGKSGIREMLLNVNVQGGAAALQEKTVEITQNGTTEVTPDTGYDGLSKATINVNVAGGSGVQPDWNQNDPSAADFIKNRIGGFYNFLTGEVPVKTYTFDGDLTGKETVVFMQDETTESGFVKVSDDIVWYSQALGSTLTYSYGTNNITEVLSTPSQVIKTGGRIVAGTFCMFVQNSCVLSIEGVSRTLPSGVWFMYSKNLTDGTMEMMCKSVVTRGGFQADGNDNSIEPLSNGMTGFVDYAQRTLYLYSSTPDSTKKFAITVNDSGVISATEEPVT